MAPLQKRALYSLAAGAVLTALLVVVLVVQGDITSFDKNTGIRYLLYTVMIGVPLAYLVLVNSIIRQPTKFDERDRIIMLKSSRTQWLAVVFSLAIWMIILTEVYHDSGSVPVAFLNLIFVSTLIISTLSQALGIIIGYGQTNRNG